MSQYGWLSWQFIPISDPKNHNCSADVLFLDGAFKMSKELDFEYFHAPVIVTPFVGKFSKLNSLILKNFLLRDVLASKFHELTSLKFIHLNECNLIDCNLSTMFAKCDNLQELYLLMCKCLNKMTLQLPKNLKKLEIRQSDRSSLELDPSQCTQLEFL